MSVACTSQGIDLSDAITGEHVNDKNRPMFAMHQPLGEWMGTTDWRMVQSGNLHYNWHRDGSDELYDRSCDPYEINNRWH